MESLESSLEMLLMRFPPLPGEDRARGELGALPDPGLKENGFGVGLPPAMLYA